jgi:hypothetical protein
VDKFGLLTIRSGMQTTRQFCRPGSSTALMSLFIKPAAVALLLLAGAGLPSSRSMTRTLPRKSSTQRLPKSPNVAIDEARRNFHTRDGRYKPFAALMESDGFVVSAVPHFDALSRKRVDILVIANAMGEFLDSTNGAVRKGAMGPAFTLVECDAVRDWVRGGGSLLLIADHVPWGDASAILARRFGVEMGLGIVLDLKHADGHPTRLVFSLENGLLGEHPIRRGRNAAGQVRKVLAFTGQSLSAPQTRPRF